MSHERGAGLQTWAVGTPCLLWPAEGRAGGLIRPRRASAEA